MIEPGELKEGLARNLGVIQWQVKDLTHADSLLQPPFRGNSLNWVLGHLAANRDVILELLGAPPLFSEHAARYRTESEPVTGEGAGVLPLEDLLGALERSQQALAAALDGTAPEAMAREVQTRQRTTTLGKRLSFLLFHETYHTGQTELLRQLAGKNDKVI